MCSKTTRYSLRRRVKLTSMINKETTISPKPTRKTRTKTKKPKFLSLRLQLSPENPTKSGKMTTKTTSRDHHNNHQLNLFPLHPENLVEEKDTHDDNNVAYFFSAADGGATTITALLGTSVTSSADDDNLSPTYDYRGGGHEGNEEGAALVRTAMKNKERDLSEEKWVCYSEVVERKEKEEEVTSCAADVRYKNMMHHQRLSLKLDYQEIMDAWSDKGPLYVHVESPQTVPDLHDDFFAHDTYHGPRDDGWQNNGGLWTVPDMIGTNRSGLMKVKEEVEEAGEEWKIGHREASVLRYKEKRRNRLFSKRIRYEVRKLNAEKRPRVKGRFVRRG